MRSLRVALDARRLQDHPLGGVGRSLAGIIELLAAEVDLLLLTDARRAPVATTIPQAPLRPPRRAPEIAWLQWSVPRALRRYDGIFHGTFNQLPFWSPPPSVVTIHDLSFEVHPEGFSLAKRRAFQIQARHAARAAAALTVPSEATKRELVDCYGVDPGRVTVTPWAVDPSFSPALAARTSPLRIRLGLPERYIVAMGGAERRGLEVAIGAWQSLGPAREDVALVVVGGERPPPSAGVIDAGVVDDATWATLLAGAEAFCYPTRYEGFGFPALESLASGTPVVCAPVGSLPEVLGDAAVWCDAPTFAGIADGLRRVLEDRGLADDVRRRSASRAAAHPTWEHTAKLTLSAYHAAAR